MSDCWIKLQVLHIRIQLNNNYNYKYEYNDNLHHNIIQYYRNTSICLSDHRKYHQSS